MVTVQKGSERRTILFDTGPEPLILMNNVARLGIDLGAIDAIVLSHGHFDHVGAVLAAISAIRNRKGGATVPIYLHPGMFTRRGYQLPDGVVVILEDVPDVDQLTECGADPFVTTNAVSLFGGLFQVSGEVERVTPFEQGLPGHVRWKQDDASWEPDPYIVDERFLAVNVGGKGLVVLTACSHAGVINVLEHAHATNPALSLHAVVGGLHLSGSTEAIISPTLDALKKFDLSVIAAGHCTGWRAQAALLQTFGTSVLAPTAVGKTYSFAAS
jgi:7,8-dihydropterin-6-yl-methyl-4-(beta-D-ribofuranosyl)aminobenzene 5'-phosphate synthase